jgi:uncharacterized protein (DUF1501 family)
MVAVPAAAIMPAVFSRAVAASIAEQPSNPAPLGERTLVIVQMFGGNDGLNTIIPAGQGTYYDLRNTLALNENDVLPLNSQTAFHPALAPLKELWDQGVLAAVEGVGYPSPSFSHFESKDTWQTAGPSGRMLEGWMGRYLEGIADTQGDAFHALSVGRSLPRALLSNKVAVPSVESVEKYMFKQDPRSNSAMLGRATALMQIYDSAPEATRFGALLDNTIDAAQRSSDALQAAKAAYTPAVEYPDTKLGKGMQLLAEAIDADLGIRVGHIKIRGFDTHADQAAVHEELLADTAGSIHAFYRDLQAHGRDKNVVVMTWSEFGRRAGPNASGGTDHGWAGPMFVAGTPVEGGLYGEAPGLVGLDNGNLRFTTDFRRVYATVLEGWLGAPADLVLGQHFEQLPFIKRDAAA